MQFALPDRLPREQENAPVTDIVYPLLHVGVHVLPLARLDVHVPAAPFVGASDASHEEPMTTRHSSRNSPDAKRKLSDDAAETQCGDWSWFVLT